MTPGVGDVAPARKPIKRVHFEDVEDFEQMKRTHRSKARALELYEAQVRAERRFLEQRELALLERQLVLKQQLQQLGHSSSSDLSGE